MTLSAMNFSRFDTDAVLIQGNEEMRRFSRFLKTIGRKYSMEVILSPPPSVRTNGHSVDSYYCFRAPSIMFDYIQYLASKSVIDYNDSEEDETQEQ